MEIIRHEMGTRFSEMTIVKTGVVDLVFIAGQVAENTALDVAGQTREVLMIIDRLLATAGGDKTNIVSARIFLASVGDYAAMNEVWDDWVPRGHAPSRATVGAKLINPEYRVEVEVTAAVPASV
jgi:enamine deaminase RidA (YjgF/YER057c/UK114 family)